MMDQEIVFKPIGIIRSHHSDLDEIPIQPVFSDDDRGTVILEADYAEGLKSLDGFSHIFLFYYFHQSDRTELNTKPFLADEKHGIFATRAPHRPNKLGMSLVALEKVEGNTIHVSGIDILDGTPLLDIKPYIARFDSRDNVRSGWQDNIDSKTAEHLGRRKKIDK